MIHEDERRTLEDWPEAKIITAKKDCTLGDHYHKVKTERFILTVGWAEMVVNDLRVQMRVGRMYEILPGQRHSFDLAAGSVLVGLCSHPFNPTDDYK